MSGDVWEKAVIQMELRIRGPRSIQMGEVSEFVAWPGENEMDRARQTRAAEETVIRSFRPQTTHWMVLEGKRT